MKIRDRIKALSRLNASELLKNPKNWKTHNARQSTAVSGSLESIGFARPVLAYKQGEEYILIDGHLRVQQAGDARIPVLVLDVTPEEADLILATHDPIADMAGIDLGKLEALMSELRPEHEQLDLFLEQFAKKAGVSNGTSVIPGANERYESLEAIKFRGWQLPMSPEVAALLESKFKAYMDEHATCLGMAERIVEII